MAYEPLRLPAYCTFPLWSGNSNSSGKIQKKEDEKSEAQKEWEQMQEAAKKAQDDFLKQMELLALKAENRAVINSLKVQEEESQKAKEELEACKTSDGGARVDSGQKGILRWAANGWTGFKNLAKSFAGYDKDGNHSKERLFWNCVGLAAGVGLCFVPGGPVILGVLGAGLGTVGVGKGILDLKEAEKKKDQAKIDEAQQDIVVNGVMGVLSAIGLRNIGAGFRTSAETAELASCAKTSASKIGKVGEFFSNAGRDMTVNAFRSAKHSVKSSWGNAFKGWDDIYASKLANYEKGLNSQIQAVDDLIAVETNPEKLTLLIEKRALLTKNRLEFTKYKGLKSKADIDKLIAKDTKTASKENIERLAARTPDSNGEVSISGWNVKAEEYAKFQRQMTNLQKAYERSFKDLIKAQENMMRKYAKSPDDYRALLDDYVSSTGVKKKWYKPSNWFSTKEAIAIGGKNPSYNLKVFGTLLTHPSGAVPKVSTTWINPIHSNTELFVQELSPEEMQNQLAMLEQSVETVKSFRTKIENASSKEEFESAMSELQQAMNQAQSASENAQAQIA